MKTASFTGQLTDMGRHVFGISEGFEIRPPRIIKENDDDIGRP
jgi:hypothetical protein